MGEEFYKITKRKTMVKERKYCPVCGAWTKPVDDKCGNCGEKLPQKPQKDS